MTKHPAEPAVTRRFGSHPEEPHFGKRQRLNHGSRMQRRRPARRVAMTLRRPFRPLRPQFDKFLFATVGNEIDGMPLTVISALARLGLDPWDEAERLSSLGSCEALEQLARLIAEVPGRIRPLAEARTLAGGLVGLLVKPDPSQTSAPQVQIRPRYRIPVLPKRAQFWVVCFVLAAAALVSVAAHGGFPFGIWSP